MGQATIYATGTGSGTASAGPSALTSFSVVAGQPLVLRVRQEGVRTLTSVTDDQGNTWTAQQTCTITGRTSHIWTAVAGSTGTLIVTMQWNLSTTWTSRADSIDDPDSGASIDTSGQFSATATSCFAAPTPTAISGLSLVLAVYSCTTSRTWTAGTGYTENVKGGGFLFQSQEFPTAQTDERAPATVSASILYAGAMISIKGASSGTTKSVTDTGSGSDSPSITCTLSTTDTGAGSDASPSCTASVPLTDSGSGSDSLTCAVSLTVTDSGSADDSGINIAVLLGLIEDSGVGSDVISQITQGIFVSLSDSGSAADSISAVAVELAVADTSSAVDDIAALAVVVGTIVDACAGVDGVSVSTSGGGTRVATITFSARAKSATFSPVGKSTEFDPNL